MNLPVYRTISTAYVFSIAEFDTIFRLVWSPLLVGAVASYFADLYDLGDSNVAGPPSLAAFGGWFLALAVQGIAWAIVAVAIHRLILFDDRRPGTFVLFSFGRAEFLFTMTLVIPFIIAVVVTLAVLIALVGTGVISSDRPPPAWLFVGPLLTFVAVLYLVIRLFLIYPIIVVERRFDYRQSWRMSRGRFWRLFSVATLGVLPTAVVFGLVHQLLRHILLDFSSQAALLESTRRFLPYHTVFIFLTSPVTVTLGVALICFSYKALKGIPEEAILPHTPG
jgi:hypothetical protein